MCWLCDHPDGTYEDYLRWMADLMLRYGWAVQYVESHSRRAPWAYTIGLTSCGLPEIVVTGLPVRRACAMLNCVGRHLLHAEPPAPGERLQLIGMPLLEIVEVAAPDVHLPVALTLLERDVHALQLVWSDDRGRWPWDRGFRTGRWPQPVLGDRGSAATRSEQGA